MKELYDEMIKNEITQIWQLLKKVLYLHFDLNDYQPPAKGKKSKNMNKPLLNEQTVFPSTEILKSVLAESYAAFEQLSAILTNEQGLILEWNYYKDGHAWLCKVLNRKKNLFWLSAWDMFFKASFYFTEKHLESFAALDITEALKEALYRAKPTGKLLPLQIEIRTGEQLPDLLKIVEFKKKLK